MKYSAIFILSLLLCATVAMPAQAQRPRPKPTILGKSLGWIDHRENQKAIYSYSNPHDWHHPDQWHQASPTHVNFKEREAVITQAKTHGLIQSMMASDNVATVYTGPLFKELSYPDKQFLMRVIATHYDILDSDYGMFTIRDGETHNFLGTYTRYGFQSE